MNRKVIFGVVMIAAPIVGIIAAKVTSKKKYTEVPKEKENDEETTEEKKEEKSVKESLGSKALGGMLKAIRFAKNYSEELSTVALVAGIVETIVSIVFCLRDSKRLKNMEASINILRSEVGV